MKRKWIRNIALWQLLLVDFMLNLQSNSIPLPIYCCITIQLYKSKEIKGKRDYDNDESKFWKDKCKNSFSKRVSKTTFDVLLIYNIPTRNVFFSNDSKDFTNMYEIKCITLSSKTSDKIRKIIVNEPHKQYLIKIFYQNPNWTHISRRMPLSCLFRGFKYLGSSPIIWIIAY